MACRIGSHQVAPNSGTNRHQNRHQSYAHFLQSQPSDFRSNRGDFETRTDADARRILALSPTQNRHQDLVKPLSNQSKTDMQPAPPLSRDFYPTYGATERPVAVLKKEESDWRGWLVHHAVLCADLHQPHWIASHRRVQRSSRRSCASRTRAAALEAFWAPSTPTAARSHQGVLPNPTNPHAPTRTRLVFCERIGDLALIGVRKVMIGGRLEPLSRTPRPRDSPVSRVARMNSPPEETPT